VTVDLRPGEWLKFSQVQLANLGDGRTARGNVANAMQYEGDARSLIENAIGTASGDTFTANAAANVLTGKGGADTFKWMTADDSAVGKADKIDLSGIDARSATPLESDSFAWLGTGAFTGTAGQLRYEMSGGSANVYGDVTGDGVADFHLILTGATPLQTDFVL
jgi:hypothetical protein